MPRKRLPPRIRQDSKTGVWYVHYFDESKNRTGRESLGVTDEAEARTRFAYWLTLAHDPGDELAVNEALSFYVEEHLAVHAAAPDRADAALGRLREHFGIHQVIGLKPAQANQYAAFWRHRGLSNGTIRRDLSVLTAAINHNVRAGRLSRAPHVPLPPKAAPKDRWLTSQEIERLFAVAASRRPGPRLTRVERFCWIALETAARKVSIERLTWPQVDFQAGMIDFRTPGKRQTKKRQVPVPISNRLGPILKRAWDERVSDLYVLDISGAIKKSFGSLMSAADLEGVTPHTLRHTAATHMARAGVPLWQIAGVLGDTLATVEANYLHHCPEHLRGAVNYQRR